MTSLTRPVEKSEGRERSASGSDRIITNLDINTICDRVGLFENTVRAYSENKNTD